MSANMKVKDLDEIARMMISHGIDTWNRFKDSRYAEIRRGALKAKCYAIVNHDRCLTRWPRSKA